MGRGASGRGTIRPLAGTKGEWREREPDKSVSERWELAHSMNLPGERAKQKLGHRSWQIRDGLGGRRDADPPVKPTIRLVCQVVSHDLSIG